MADYDVGVVGLSSPPSLAVLQTYRPAVAVRNNGIHDALASGVLRIYSAGLLVFTSEIYSAVISPGETRDALAVGYWTPTEGTYIVIADVTCPLDQVENNNHLSPTAIIVSGDIPPEPPTVPYHASQHEEGNADELIVDGLHGRLADAQAALAHKASHQVGGSDTISVDGLTGILSTPQPIADHHEAHEDHGGDELNVEGLQGILYNLQKPQVHANEKHDPNFATSTELSNHIEDTTAVHAVATNLEQVSRKGDPDGYPELDSLGHVPPAQLADLALSNAGDALVIEELGGTRWAAATPAEHGDDKHDGTVASLGQNSYVPVTELGVEPQGVAADYVLRHDQSWGRFSSPGLQNSAAPVTLSGLLGETAILATTVPTAYLSATAGFLVSCFLHGFQVAIGPAQSLTLKLYVNALLRCSLTLQIPSGEVFDAKFTADIVAHSLSRWQINALLIGETVTAHTPIIRPFYDIADFARPNTDCLVELKALPSMAATTLIEVGTQYLVSRGGIQ